MRFKLPLLALLALVGCDDGPAAAPAAVDASVFPDFERPADAAPPIGAPPGAACDARTPCARGDCEHGVCSIICARDGDCPPEAAACVGRGGAGRCTTRCASTADCGAGLVCAVEGPGQGFCVAPGAGGAGDACSRREDCASWFCAEGQCLAPCDEGGCAAGTACLPLHTQAVCVAAGPGADEDRCATGADCAEGVCRGGRCTHACALGEDCPEDRICVAYPALGLCERRCAETADCGEGALCRATSAGRLCATQGEGGADAACTVGEECASGRCQGERCAAPCADAPCPAGQACVRDVSGAACRPAGPGAAGSPCDAGADCESGVCGGGICAADCAGGAPCPAETRCTRFVDGDFCFPPCRDDADCPAIAYCALGFPEGGTCFWRGLGEADAPCAQDADCRSGRCDAGACLGACVAGECPAGRTCRDFGTAALCSPAPLPSGAACEADDACAEGLDCVAGRCLPGCDAGCPPATLCHGGRCHPACETAADCRPGRACNRFDDDAPFCQARGAGEVGAACAASGDCADGLCFADRCRAPCGGGAPCGEGEACVPLGGAAWCLPSGPGALGDVCGADAECAGGLCVGRRCAETCEAQGECPPPAACRPLRGGDFCVLECDAVSGEGCLAAEQCVPLDGGGGRCVLPGPGADIGEPCQTLEDCTALASSCYDAGDGLRCRAACDLERDLCPESAVCAPGEPDRVEVCVPAGRGGDMAACAQATDCASGWCIEAYLGGRCGRSCAGDADCDATSRCVDLARNPGAPFFSCAPRCLTDRECAPGLQCRQGLAPFGACY
ncbi:MAG: hypothetical protein R3F60_21755 [bacterium]